MRRETAAISPITEIIADIRAGRIVVLVDDEDRENEGDLFFAAEFVTADKINFLATHGRGLVCMPITEEHAERLGLRPMVARNRTRHGTNFTASIEAAEGISTGISAHDRALTIRVATSSDARAEHILQPGHQDHCRRLRGKVEADVRLAHQARQLAVHHADQRLPRRQAADHLLAHRLRADRGDEVLHHRQRAVGLEQRDAHLAQRVLHVRLGEASLAANGLDDAREARSEVIEHGQRGTGDKLRRCTTL